MGVETLLLESGTVLATGLALALYNELRSRSAAKPTIAQHAAEEESRTISITHLNKQISHQTPTTGESNSRTMMISEAPAPFADESFSTHNTSLPTDISAVPNIGPPSAGSAQVFVIPLRRRKRVNRKSTTNISLPQRRKIVRRNTTLVRSIGATDQSVTSTEHTEMSN